MIRLRLALLLVLVTAACGPSGVTPSLPVPSATYEAATPTLIPSSTTLPPTATTTATLTPSPSATPTATMTATPVPPTATSAPTSTPTATPTATPRPDDLWLGDEDFRLHPDGAQFYSGDLISFQVSAHHAEDGAGSDYPDVDFEIWVGPPDQGERVAEDRIQFFGNPDGEASLSWAWDTSRLEGPFTLTAVLDPRDEIQIGDEDPTNNVVTRTIELAPRAEMPLAWQSADWQQQSSSCCEFHFITGTAAQRDIAELMQVADRAIAYVGQKLDVPTDEARLDIYLIDRVLGQGGFAGGALILSYLDRFYAGGDWPLVFRHEGSHVLDQRIAELRPTFLTEGLAVYVSGGHYRKEPLAERAAALLVLDRYIPLVELADSFYPSQHEIGYLEAGSFVDYLVGRYGWERFAAFYGGIEESEAGPSGMIDAALQEHLGLTFEQAETDWLAALSQIDVSDTQLRDLQLTIEFYDTVRRYQQDWDPSAYFLEAWLPSLEEAEKREITADFLRHPDKPLNITLETMFVAADRAIDQGEYDRAEETLRAVLDVLNAGGDQQANPLAQQYYDLVLLTATAGYEAQKIDLDRDAGLARVLAAAIYQADTLELTFVQRAGIWRPISWGN